MKGSVAITPAKRVVSFAGVMAVGLAYLLARLACPSVFPAAATSMIVGLIIVHFVPEPPSRPRA